MFALEDAELVGYGSITTIELNGYKVTFLDVTFHANITLFCRQLGKDFNDWVTHHITEVKARSLVHLEDENDETLTGFYIHPSMIPSKEWLGEDPYMTFHLIYHKFLMAQQDCVFEVNERKDKCGYTKKEVSMLNQYNIDRLKEIHRLLTSLKEPLDGHFYRSITH